MQGGDKYINRYPEKDLVRILKESGYHSSEWEETDLEEDQQEDEVTTINAVEKKTSLYIYDRWWRSSSVCIFYNFYLYYYINANLIYLFKLKRLLHQRIDPTVEFLRKKQPQLKRKRANKEKTTGVPPVGAPSWTLSIEALEKLGRSTDKIPIYDPEDSEDDHQHGDNDNNIVESSKRNKRKSNVEDNNHTAESSKGNKRKSKHDKQKKSKSKSKTRKVILAR